MLGCCHGWHVDRREKVDAVRWDGEGAAQHPAGIDAGFLVGDARGEAVHGLAEDGFIGGRVGAGEGCRCAFAELDQVCHGDSVGLLGGVGPEGVVCIQDHWQTLVFQEEGKRAGQDRLYIGMPVHFRHDYAVPEPARGDSLAMAVRDTRARGDCREYPEIRVRRDAFASAIIIAN